MSTASRLMNRDALSKPARRRTSTSRPRTRFVAEFLGAMNWIDQHRHPPRSHPPRARHPEFTAPLTAGPHRDFDVLGKLLPHSSPPRFGANLAVAEIQRSDNSYAAGEA